MQMNRFSFGYTYESATTCVYQCLCLREWCRETITNVCLCVINLFAHVSRQQPVPSNSDKLRLSLQHYFKHDVFLINVYLATDFVF